MKNVSLDNSSKASGSQNAHMKTSPFEAALFAAKFVKSPNYAPDGSGWPVWYASGRETTVPAGLDIQPLDDRIRLFSKRFFGTAYSKRSYWDTVTEQVFADVPELLAWIEANGRLTPPALPAGIWGD